MPRTSRVSGLVAGMALLMAACGGPGTGSAARSGEYPITAGADDRASIAGAGSTLVAPIVRDWIDQYRRVAPGVTIEYRPVGSVLGLREFRAGTADFAASEVPFEPETAESPDGEADATVVPWATAGIGVAYNLPGVSTLNLSPTTLSAIFSGRTTRWDDGSIRADNAGLRLPSTAIRVVHRSDPSGTTQAFSRFLRDAASGSWTLGSGPTVSWATGVGADGSDGVVATVAGTSGSVGYVEAGQAARAGLGVAAVENGAGRFVLPTSAKVGSAVGGANPEAPDAYPIAAVSQVVFSTAGVEGAKRTALRHFVAWTLTEGQRSADRLGYSPVPLPVLVNAITTVQATEDPGTGRP